MIKFIDWNERRHRQDAVQYLKQNTSITFQSAQTHIKQHRLTDEITLTKITERICMEKQFNNSKATVVALSDDLIFVGTSLG